MTVKRLAVANLRAALKRSCEIPDLIEGDIPQSGSETVSEVILRGTMLKLLT